MSVEIFPIALVVGVTAAVTAAAFVVTRALLPRSKLSKVSQRIIALVVEGPLVASFISFGLFALSEYLNAAAPGLLPSLARPYSLQLILEVVVLAISIRVVGSIIRTVARSFEQMREAERVLVYGVYAVGLIALAYVILSSPITPAVASNVWTVVNFMVGLLVTYLTVSTVNVIVKRYSTMLTARDERLRTAIAFVRRLGLAVIGLIGVSVAVFTSYPSAGAAVASLFIAAGFGSIVIGLAAQSSLANIFAGMVLAFSQPFKIGNAVLFQMPWGAEWCWVEDMTMNFTVLKTWDNRRLVIPNQMFLSSSFVNYDLNDSSKLCIVFITIAFESDLDKAIEIMKNAALQHPDFLPAGNLPVVHLMDIGDANGAAKDANASPGLSLRLLSRAKDQPTNFQMSKDLLYTIRKEFQKNGIQIAYPRRELVLRGELNDSLQGNRRPQGPVSTGTG